MSNFLSLNRPLDWVNEALDRTDTEPEILFPPTTLPAAPVGTTTTTAPPPRSRRSAHCSCACSATRKGINLGVGLQNATAADPLITATYDGKVSTGLARPDYYNWPARVLEQLSQQDADVVVLHFGANDHQNLTDVARRLGGGARHARVGAGVPPSRGGDDGPGAQGPAARGAGSATRWSASRVATPP